MNSLVAVIYYLAIVVPIVISIIYDKRDPVKSLSWILVVALIPFVGSLLYFIIGQSFRKQKIFNQKYKNSCPNNNKLISRQLYKINSPLLSLVERPFYRDIATLLLNNNQAPYFENKSLNIYADGSELFDNVFKRIKEAKSHIHLESYIICDDNLGTKMADALIEKALEGVEVRVIFDDVGSWKLKKEYINRLKGAGVKIYPFMPVLFPLFTSKINYRNHRKIIVIDGTIGFTGGMNIADRYIDGPKYIAGKWRDTHIEIDGGSVSTLQSIFLSDWAFVSGENVHDDEIYFPRYEKCDSGVVLQIASSGPDSDWAAIMQVFFAAITKAQDHIYIVSPYFLPNESILTALKVAALSGIDVRIIIPNSSDTKIVYWATRSYITELVKSGVKIYLYRGGFIHSKVIVVDGIFGSVGSANMDIRSFEDNFEVTAFIYDIEKCRELEDIFAADLTLSRQVHLRWWLKRLLLHRFYESLARLLSPIL